MSRHPLKVSLVLAAALSLGHAPVASQPLQPDVPLPLSTARAWINRGDYQEAASLLRSYFRQSKSNDARYAYLYCKYKAGSYRTMLRTAASPAFAEVLSQPRARILVGLALWRRNLLMPAIKQWAGVLADDPGNDLAWECIRVAVLSAHRAYRTTLLEQLQAQLPRTEFSEAFFLGLLYSLRGPDRSAETNLLKACKISPRSRAAGVALRHFYRSQDNRPAAERLDRAIRSLAPGESLTASGSSFQATSWRPTARSTQCRLPWAAGRAFYVASNDDRLATPHSGRGQYALDFLLPMETPILAARRGTVVEVSDRHSRTSRHDFDTRIVVDHGDGTYARYYHLRGGTARVTEGQAVRQGEPLAQAGRTGACQSRHLHFEVVRKARLRLNGTRIYSRWETVPLRFEEVQNLGHGQLTGRWLVSGNQPVH